MATVLSLLFLTILLSLGFAFMNGVTLSLKQSENFRSVMDARLASESGLQFMLYHLRKVRLPNDTTEATFVPELHAALSQRLSGTANLSGQAVQNTGKGVFVPEIACDEGRSFSAWVNWLGGDRCTLLVKGSAGGADRYVSLDLVLSPKLPGVFYYGLASRGQIKIGGSTKIVGVNYREEANLFSATTAYNDAVHIKGDSVVVSGDIFLSGDWDYVLIEGTPSIGGATDPETISRHVHCGMEAPDFPKINTSPLAAHAVNIVDSSTRTDTPGQEFSNIRIAAGTNPTFARDTVVNGVVYVEAPNIVTFEGHATVNAIIVTEDKNLPSDTCQIVFAGTVDANGIEGLPDTPEWSTVKQHTGTFVLAPGFGASFQGNFQTINGSILADQITFTGTSVGTIKGTIVGMKDLPLTLEGNVNVYVDKSGLDEDPAGILKPRGMDANPDSYRELLIAPH